MGLGTDDRGVSEVVGFILIFGLLVAVFVVYQGVVVPSQNEAVEFDHNEAVQGQLQDLRNAIVTTAATGSGQGVSVTLGATYPKRTIATNLGVTSGALSTASTDQGVRINYARALDAETRDYLDTDSNGPLGPFQSKALRYRPVYSFYSNAPLTYYENTVVFNRFGDVNLTVTDQVMIEDRRITVIVLNGTLAESGQDTVSVSTEAISTSSERIAIENTSDDQVTLTIPTHLPASRWEALLADELSPSGHVTGVASVSGAQAVRISFEQGVTYELRMAKIGIGDVTSPEGASYLTDVDGDDVSIPEGGSQKLVVAVRDRFNNPVSSVSVAHNPVGQGSVSPSTATTDATGQASFSYTAPNDVATNRDIDITVTIDNGGDPTETVTFDVEVLNTDGSGGPPGGPGGP